MTYIPECGMCHIAKTDTAWARFNSPVSNHSMYVCRECYQFVSTITDNPDAAAQWFFVLLEVNKTNRAECLVPTES